MMKVKPFSYHIPRRKASRISGYSRGNCKLSTECKYSSTTFTKKVCSSLGGVGTLLIFILLGFIGVAGQGKLGRMSASTAFPQRSHHGVTGLSYKELDDSLSSLEVLEADDDSRGDEVLQRVISSMGEYGVKTRNNNSNNNNSSTLLHSYSSHSVRHHPRSSTSTVYDDDKKYKLGTILLSTPYKSRLSLYDPSEKVGGFEEEMRVSQQHQSEFPRERQPSRQRDDEDDAKVQDSLSQENIPLPPTLGMTTPSSYVTGVDFFNASFSPERSTRGSRSRNLQKHAHRDDEVSVTDDEPNYTSLLFSTDDVDDYGGDDLLLEKFIPGNSTHLSGRHRFRQSSQAEVDGVVSDEDGGGIDGNSLLSSTSSRRRPRRSVVHLYDMVVCSTGCNPLIFKGYGCYCGFLGSGLTVDGIDKCCAKHDWCYHHAKCPPLLTYFVPYYWRCDHGRPQCVTDFRGWKGICGAHLCECDRQFAECLKKFPCPRSRAMCVTSPWRFWQNLLMTPSMRYRRY